MTANDRESRLPQARELHRTMLTVDTHCDTPGMMACLGWDIGVRHATGTLLGGDLDLVRMKEGGLSAAFLAVYVSQGPRTPEGYAQARDKADRMLDMLDRQCLAHPELCERALAPADARRLHGLGKRAIFVGMENGYPLGQDLRRLDDYHRRGVRYLTLCHAQDNDICAACTSLSRSVMVPRDSEDTGLSAFGAAVVERMNALGMLVDVSHTSERTVREVLAVSKAPVIASHSGARAVADHPRNLTDEAIRGIAAGGGVIQVCFVPGFLRPEIFDPERDRAAMALWTRREAHYARHAIGEDPAQDAAFEGEHRALAASIRATVKDVADHIDHIVRIAGIAHVGIGSDFDGGGQLADCRDVSELPHLTGELLCRGYSEGDLRKLWGENTLRAFDQVLDAAR